MNGVETNGGWQSSKGVPLAMIGAIILQSVWVGWYMGQLTTKVDILIASQGERYSQDDARRDHALLEAKMLLIRTELSAAVSERNERLSLLNSHDVDLSRRIEMLEQRRGR